MNILLWSSYVAHPVGGQERVSLELALQLHQRGHHVVLVGPFDNAPELRARIPAELPYHSFDLYRARFRRHLAARRLMLQLMQEHRIEIVSAHGSLLAPLFCCKHLNTPMVWTMHGVESRPPTWLGRLKTKIIGQFISGPTTHIVMVSQASADLFLKLFPKLGTKKLHVIHNGASDEAELGRLPLPHAGPPWNLGFIGRLAERKQPLDLVQIAQRLEGHLDFQLHVFGSGPLLPALTEAIRQHRLEHRFVLHGYWSKGSAGMLEQIQILVHTDRLEPFGGALVEAQLAGRPVAAYRVGGNPEIVSHGETGWLAPLGDLDGLAAGVQRIAGKDFERFSAAARQRATQRFSL